MKKLIGFDSPLDFWQTWLTIRNVVAISSKLNKTTGIIRWLQKLEELTDEAPCYLTRFEMALEQLLDEAGYLEAIREEFQKKQMKGGQDE